MEPLRASDGRYEGIRYQLIALLILVCAGCVVLLSLCFSMRSEAWLKIPPRSLEKERQTGSIGTLVVDPATGEYRLKREDE